MDKLEDKMTAKMTDEKVIEIGKTQMTEYVDMGCFRNPEQALPFLREGFTLGFRNAERIYLPQIQQLQGEVERLKEEKLKLYNDLADAKGWARAINISDVNYMSELATLTAKHEKMVKGLKELRLFDATIMETDGHSATFKTAVVFHAEQIQRLLTESEDK
jgi:hypothetical protein